LCLCSQASDAFVLGEIESGELDINAWQLKGLPVSLNGAATKTLCFERPFLGKVMVCMPVSAVKVIKDTAVLSKAIHELRELKECKTDDHFRLMITFLELNRRSALPATANCLVFRFLQRARAASCLCPRLRRPLGLSLCPAA
jgi:hypothetical protein